MKLGLIADTHDNLTQIEKAVKLFNRKKVDLVLHAGDYVAPFSLNVFKKLSCDYVGVFGNNDGEVKGLTLKSKGRIKKAPRTLREAGRWILLTHDINKINLGNRKYDLVVYGHSHEKAVEKKDGILFVNPGECSGWLNGSSSVAVIDLDTMNVTFFGL
ncbi:metallophosphoesterase [Candidatus Omnitrophota bacterium]